MTDPKRGKSPDFNRAERAEDVNSTAILLIGRRTRYAQKPFEKHADRLDQRTIVDEVHTATYESDPVRELRDDLRMITADRIFAVPMCTAHTFETLDELPAALSYASGAVQYCDPLGHSPVVTELLTDTATELVPPTDDASLIIVGFGSSSKPYHKQTTEYHAARIREQSGYGEVVTSYLLQNPAVECVRYNISNNQVVAVPLFFTRSEATKERIPEKLDLEHGDIEYADPLGTHVRITDAIHAEVEKQRVLALGDRSPTASFEARLLRDRQPIATDGDGVLR